MPVMIPRVLIALIYPCGLVVRLIQSDIRMAYACHGTDDDDDGPEHPTRRHLLLDVPYLCNHYTTTR